MKVLSMSRITIIFSLMLIWSCQPQTELKNQKTISSTAELPSFRDYETTIIEHGAIADGKSLNTEAINNAISACSEKGGGKVIIPEGLWITGPIQMKSNVNLHVSKGALVMFSKNLDDYPLIENYFEGNKQVRAMPLLYANELQNIAITGEGVFDGSGQIWRPVKKSKLTSSEWRRLLKKGGAVDEEKEIWYPNEAALEVSRDRRLLQTETIEEKEKYKAYLRPSLVNILNCDKVLFDGPTFQNSPGWCIHPLLSKNITFVNINVRNPWNAQNGDGIDFESCRFVHLENSTLDVGDDAICLKSGKNEEGRRRGVPTEDVMIKNCVVYHGHGGFVVGSEMSGGVRNVKITDCTFMGTDVGLRFKSNRERGGIVENIEISNINMIDISTNAIGFNLFYGGLSVVEQNELGEKQEIKAVPVTEATPQFKNITIKNVVCNGAHTAIYVNGLPEMPVENMILENVHIKADNGGSFTYAKGIKLKDVVIESADGVDFKFNNTESVEMDAGVEKQNRKTNIVIEGERSKKYVINYKITPELVLNSDVNPEEIKVN